MSAAARLYTPELLALAVELAKVPPLDTADVRGEARSPTCGSTLAVDLALDGNGRIARLGMRVRACAVGQSGGSPSPPSQDSSCPSVSVIAPSSRPAA